jgi:N-acyl homoserine lactone hydrolase
VTGQVDMTLDASASQASIRRLRELAAKDRSNVIVCGHDRLLGLDGDRVLCLSELQATVSARLWTEFEKETVIDLTQATHSVDISPARPHPARP